MRRFCFIFIFSIIFILFGREGKCLPPISYSSHATGKSIGIETVDPDPFALRVSVQGVSGGDIRYDIYNFFSVHPEADDGYDIYDVREPTVPPPGNTIDAFFVCGSFKLSLDTKRNFSDTSKTWTFKIEDLPSGMEVTLMWPRNRLPTGDDISYGVENLDPRWAITLRDDIIAEEMDMRADTFYTFTYGSCPRLFTITLTDVPLFSPEVQKPASFVLGQNFPNPFNAETRFTLNLSNSAEVTVEIFDVNGRCVRKYDTGRLDAGLHDFIWNGKNDYGQRLPGGIYFYRTAVGENSRTRKMILLK